jgi:hypothetical protein
VALVALLTVLLNGVCWCTPTKAATSNATHACCNHSRVPDRTTPASNGDSGCSHCAAHQLRTAEPGGTAGVLPSPELAPLLELPVSPVVAEVLHTARLSGADQHALPGAVRRSTCVLLL